MIPKIIHYCWFGTGTIPVDLQKFIESWSLKLQDYDIVRWDESVFDIQSAPDYVQQAYFHRKFAFVSDYVRLYALNKYGGIYFDTDIEVLKPFPDSFLHNKFFIGFEEDTNHLATCVMGSEPHSEISAFFMKLYNNMSFVNEDNTLNLKPNVYYLTEALMSKGWEPIEICVENFKDIVSIYTSDFFCPKLIRKNKYLITPNTITIHHFSGSWVPFRTKLKMYLYRLIGAKYVRFLKRVFNIK